MDNQPQTRQEKKGVKKSKDKNIYSSKHVRVQEALREKGLGSSTSKIPQMSTNPSSSKK